MKEIDIDEWIEELKREKELDNKDKDILEWLLYLKEKGYKKVYRIIDYHEYDSVSKDDVYMEIVINVGGLGGVTYYKFTKDGRIVAYNTRDRWESEQR